MTTSVTAKAGAPAQSLDALAQSSDLLCMKEHAHVVLSNNEILWPLPTVARSRQVALLDSAWSMLYVTMHTQYGLARGDSVQKASSVSEQMQT